MSNVVEVPFGEFYYRDIATQVTKYGHEAVKAALMQQFQIIESVANALIKRALSKGGGS